jgi:hypothetical protein
VTKRVSDQVGAAHGLQRFAQQRPVFRVVIAQEGLVQFALASGAHHGNASESVVTCAAGSFGRVPHGGGQRQRRRQEGLHLVEAEAVLLQPQRQFQHVLVGGAGVRGDEVGDQVLLLAGFLRELVEHLLEALVAAPMPGFIIFDSGPSSVCSGAILR